VLEVSPDAHDFDSSERAAHSLLQALGSCRASESLPTMRSTSIAEGASASLGSFLETGEIGRPEARAQGRAILPSAWASHSVSMVLSPNALAAEEWTSALRHHSDSSGMAVAAVSATARVAATPSLSTALASVRTPAIGEQTAASAAAGRLLKHLRRPLEEEAAADAMSTTPLDERLFSVFSIDLYRSDMRTLRPREWLNDNIVNFYIELIKEREPEGLLIWNTFFYARLHADTVVDDAVAEDGRGYNYSNVRRWTLRPEEINIMERDLILVPINYEQYHWALVALWPSSRRICYMDSLSDTVPSLARKGAEAVEKVLRWVADDTGDKGYQSQEDVNAWTQIDPPPGLPQQSNGCDCGAFLLMYMEYVSLGLGWDMNFTQEHMGEFRRRIAGAIMARGSDDHFRLGY
jgi:sentrin-specific protease 1